MSFISESSTDKSRRRFGPLGLSLFGIALLASAATRTSAAESAPTYADQGPQWTTGARSLFYTQDQGAQMIPLAWLKALKAADGTPFLAGSLARYGYLPNPETTSGLPVGFTLADSGDGRMVGMTCAACHTRQISIAGQPFRIDGGPAIADFQSLLADLDAATVAVLADAPSFKAFATSVLGADAGDDAKVAVLRADLTVWSARFHTLMRKALPTERRWGPARLDAVSMILDRVTGLDLGPPPTYTIPDNIVQASAPTRYPFLWNASWQDHTQWPGFAPNGDDLFALSRNLGEVYGVFGLFHPENATGSATLFDRNYIVHNSANFTGLATLEQLIKRIGPPAWQWPVDPDLVARGKTIYETWRTGLAATSCAGCHGIQPNIPDLTWKTPIVNVGTDRSEWRVLGRYAASGSLEGASIPFVSPTILSRDLAISILKISVAGAVAEYGTSRVTRDVTPGALPGMSLGGAGPEGAVVMDGQVAPVSIGPIVSLPSIVTTQTATTSLPQLNAFFRVPGLRAGSLPVSASDQPPKNGYESRVLQGIWAAAPYLHNGSVPTLADLLKPADQRPKSFAVGPAYDLSTVGLATEQPASTFTFQATGCDGEEIASGDSNCGHEYGTDLQDADKKALLEYLKVL